MKKKAFKWHFFEKKRKITDMRKVYVQMGFFLVLYDIQNHIFMYQRYWLYNYLNLNCMYYVEMTTYDVFFLDFHLEQHSLIYFK